jgi:hypothetical protein
MGWPDVRNDTIDWITVAATPHPIMAVLYTGNHQIVLQPEELREHIAACNAVLAEIAPPTISDEGQAKLVAFLQCFADHAEILPVVLEGGGP